MTEHGDEELDDQLRRAFSANVKLNVDDYYTGERRDRFERRLLDPPAFEVKRADRRQQPWLPLLAAAVVIAAAVLVGAVIIQNHKGQPTSQHSTPDGVASATHAPVTVSPLPSPSGVQGWPRSVRPLSPAAVRRGPSETFPLVNTLVTGRAVLIDCYLLGQPQTGPYGTTEIWDHLVGASSAYVSDAYVYTGTNTALVPKCVFGKT